MVYSTIFPATPLSIKIPGSCPSVVFIHNRRSVLKVAVNGLLSGVGVVGETTVTLKRTGSGLALALECTLNTLHGILHALHGTGDCLHDLACLPQGTGYIVVTEHTGDATSGTESRTDSAHGARTAQHSTNTRNEAADNSHHGATLKNHTPRNQNHQQQQRAAISFQHLSSSLSELSFIFLRNVQPFRVFRFHTVSNVLSDKVGKFFYEAFTNVSIDNSPCTKPGALRR